MALGGGRGESKMEMLEEVGINVTVTGSVDKDIVLIGSSGWGAVCRRVGFYCV